MIEIQTMLDITLQIDDSKLLPFFAFRAPEPSIRGSKMAESEVIDRNNWQFQDEASLSVTSVSIPQFLPMGSKRPYLKFKHLYYYFI